jgi:hypothetical protein
MYAHPDERLAMGQAGYKFAQSQLWEAKIRRFVDELYPAVLGEIVDEPAGSAQTGVGV